MDVLVNPAMCSPESSQGTWRRRWGGSIPGARRTTARILSGCSGSPSSTSCPPCSSSSSLDICGSSSEGIRCCSARPRAWGSWQERAAQVVTGRELVRLRGRRAQDAGGFEAGGGDDAGVIYGGGVVDQVKIVGVRLLRYVCMYLYRRLVEVLCYSKFNSN
jgi:hypothetical protein